MTSIGPTHASAGSGAENVHVLVLTERAKATFHSAAPAIVARGTNATSASPTGTASLGTAGSRIGSPDTRGRNVLTGPGTINTGESTTAMSSVGGTPETTCHNGGTDRTTCKSILCTYLLKGVETSTVVPASPVNSRMVNNMTVSTTVGLTVKDTVDWPKTDFCCSVSSPDTPLRPA